jgi:hypothetical protein
VADQYSLEPALPWTESCEHVYSQSQHGAVCVDLQSFVAKGMYSAMLHYSAYKGKRFRCKSKLLSIVEKM